MLFCANHLVLCIQHPLLLAWSVEQLIDFLPPPLGGCLQYSMLHLVGTYEQAHNVTRAVMGWSHEKGGDVWNVIRIERLRVPLNSVCKKRIQSEVD